jgi:catechol 2,3-dioxygenase-like lactoylglutathione lyase family enzyme
MITGLDHVQVAAPPGCEAAARSFYGEALGLPELAKPAPLRAAGGAWFACGAQQLHVGVAEPFTPATKGHPALMTAGPDALRALAERLAAAGHEPRWDDRLPGYERFYCDDPWGNRVELLARATPAEDGERPER